MIKKFLLALVFVFMIFFAQKTYAANPSANISVSPQVIDYGGSTTITWNTSGIDSNYPNSVCTGGSNWVPFPGMYGTYQISGLTTTTTFTISCEGNLGTASDSATVTVDVLPPTLTSSSPASGTYYANSIDFSATYYDVSGVRRVRICSDVADCDPGTSDYSDYTNGQVLPFAGSPTNKLTICTRAGDGYSAGLHSPLHWSQPVCSHYDRRLARPTVTATASGPSSINLTWVDNSNEETGYRVYKSDGTLISGYPSMAGTGTSKTVSFTGLACGNYSYKVYIEKATEASETVDSNTVNLPCVTSSLSVSSSPTSLTIPVGETGNLNITAYPSNVSNLDFSIRKSSGKIDVMFDRLDNTSGTLSVTGVSSSSSESVTVTVTGTRASDGTTITSSVTIPVTITTPAPTVTGNIYSNGPCYIPLGSNSCSADIFWSTNPDVVSTITSSYPSANTIVTQDTSGDMAVTIPYGGRNFYLYYQGNLLGSTNVGANCEAGQWNGSICAIPVSLPTVTNPTVGNITPTSAVLGANVTSNGGGTITDRGTCYGPNANPDKNDTCLSASGTTGIFSHTRTGLTPNTAYHFRAYAKNSAGYGYSEDVSFTTTYVDLTADAVTPTTVTAGKAATFSSTAINNGTASTGSSFSYFFQKFDDGDQTTVDYPSSTVPALAPNGDWYSISSPQITLSPAGDNYSLRVCVDKTSSGSSGTISELNENNNCGPWTRITVTNEATVPVIGAVTVTNILTTTATFTTNVSSDGGSGITERGFCFSTDPNPDKNWANCFARTGTTGIFTKDGSGFTPRETYHVRAYALNGIGISYSPDAEFTMGPDGNLASSDGTYSCTISAGNKSCKKAFTWSTSKTEYDSAVTSSKNDQGEAVSTTLSDNNNGTNVDFIIPYGSRDFYLYNAGFLLGQKTVSATCVGGTNWNSVTGCTAIPNAATANISADPSSVPYNGSSTITWSSTNATSCAASGDWSGTKATSGTESTGSLTSAKTYTITCTGTGGTSDPASATVSVAGQMSGTINSSAASCIIPTGNSSCDVNISWNTINPVGTSAVTANGMANVNGNSGSQQMAVPYNSRTFYLYNNAVPLDQVTVSSDCLSEASFVDGKCTEIVYSPSASLFANPDTIIKGDSSTLSWSSSHATSCVGTGFNTGGSTSGSVSVSPQVTTTYSIVCTGPGGQAPDSKTVTVKVTGKKPGYQEE